MPLDMQYLEELLWAGARLLVLVIAFDLMLTGIAPKKKFRMTLWAISMSVMGAGLIVQGVGWLLARAGDGIIALIGDRRGWHLLWWAPSFLVAFLLMGGGGFIQGLGESLVRARRRRAAHGRNSGHPHPP